MRSVTFSLFFFLTVAACGQGRVPFFADALSPCSVDTLPPSNPFSRVLNLGMGLNRPDSIPDALWYLDGFFSFGYCTPPFPPLESCQVFCGAPDSLLTTAEVFQVFGCDSLVPSLNPIAVLFGLSGSTAWTPCMNDDQTLQVVQYDGYPHGGQTSWERTQVFVFRRVKRLGE